MQAWLNSSIFAKGSKHKHNAQTRLFPPKKHTLVSVWSSYSRQCAAVPPQCIVVAVWSLVKATGWISVGGPADCVS